MPGLAALLFATSTCLTGAQSSQSSSQAAAVSPAAVVQAARAQAALEPLVEKTIPALAPNPAPASGTYWTLQGGSIPLPFNPFPELPVYALTPGAWLVDDRSVDYPALRAAQARERATFSSETALFSSSNSLPYNYTTNVHSRT